MSNFIMQSTNEKIRNFGQLRTLGTTALQIKKMINYESRYLSWLGIPPGIVLGAIVGTVLGSNEFSSGFSPINIPFVMIGVSIICTLMVKLSVRKPLKIAATTSPIEAVRYIAYRNAPMQSRKHNKKISPYSLALLNLGRDKKKTASTLLSLIFGGLLLFISASAAVSNTPEQFVREKFFVNGGSFRIYLSEESVGKNEINNPLNESLREELLNTKGIQKIIPLRDSVGMCHYSINGNATEGMCDIISVQSTEGNFSFVEQHLIDGQMPKNQFEVLLTDGYMELGVTKGTPIKITNSGEEIECIVSGFFDKSFVGTENGTDAIDPANLIITQELAQQLFPNTENFAYSWEIITDKTYNDEIESTIQQKITSKEKGLSICSYNDVVEYRQLSGEKASTFHKLLFVHAEDTNAGVLRATMLQKGFDLILIPSIDGAKERIIEDEEIELILCELELPDGTAMDLFHMLRRVEGMFQMKNPPVRLLPFFILTENNDLATEYEYRHEGVNDYITAPVNIPELIRRVLFFVE